MLRHTRAKRYNCSNGKPPDTLEGISKMLETLKVTGAIALVIATATAVLSLLAWAYGF